MFSELMCTVHSAKLKRGNGKEWKLVDPFSEEGARVVRWCWVNFKCRGVLQFGLE